MSQISSEIFADEKTWQMKFYEQLFGLELDEKLKIDRSTDGYTKGIIFEHKQNVTSYGKSKALSQALIYLCRFNRDGIPVPAKICLVSQDEQKCFVYDSQNYIDYINDIEQYANLKASDGIVGFESGKCNKEISFSLDSASQMKEMMDFVSKVPQNLKVEITTHNVYGWSGFYYSKAKEYGQKPEKKEFFNELKNPQKTLKYYIEPWKGEEADFKFIMDLLNDPMTQKKLGAFYTPPEYAKLAVGLVEKAIKRAVDYKKKDYIILDRCAGSGNLEMFFGDDVLSHVIVSTYELKEWIVLKDRFGNRVRYIIPPVPKEKTKFPDLNQDGFLTGANALSKDIIDNPEVRKYIDDENCAVILFENPPYVETTGIEFQKANESKKSTDWKSSFVVQEMKKKIGGAASNDMANAFIWSAFKYFLRQPSDSYVVFSPVKYWKTQQLVKRQYGRGYALNKLHFHAPTPACITCIHWINEEDCETDEITLGAYDLDENRRLVNQGNIIVRKAFKKFSEEFYEGQQDSDTKDGILCGLDGKEKKKGRIAKTYNKNIVGYMVCHKFGLDNPRLSSCLLVAGRFDGNGFYLRKNNYLEKLPLFAATRYPDHFNDWKVMSMVMKSADKAEKYLDDARSGVLDIYLHRVLFWVCMSHYPHMRSLKGSDGRDYLNELCFENNTLAKKEWNKFLKNSGYEMTDEEKNLEVKMKRLLKDIKSCDEYKSEFKYGLYQIDEEINVKIQKGVNPDGSPKMVFKYGDLNNLIKEIKALSRDYYKKNLVETLFEYELLK